MKKVNFVVGILFLLIICFSFLIVGNDVVIGQTTNSSDVAVTLNSKFTGIWKVKVKKPVSEPTPIPTATTAKTCTELESSQTSYFNICSDNGYDNVCFDKFTSVYKGCTKNTNNDCTESNTNADQNILCPVIVSSPTPTLTSKTPARKLLAHITDDSPSSNIITFKLCVKEGKLEGTVHQGGAFLNGVITGQTIISENEVELTALSQDSKTTKIKLKLTGDRQFQVMFTDGHTSEGRKLNENRGCLAPGKGPKGPKGSSIEPTPSGGAVMGGPTMSEPNNNSSGTVQPSMDTPPKPTPSIEGGPSMTGPEEPSMTGNEEGSGTEMNGPPPFAMGSSENPPTMDTVPESINTPPAMSGMST
ncbi:MAG: hypothetical protein HYY52_07990 [Candidatus Melainabacteria bacterium]|nr:hypothetical protein [Candidatus Melainabacteria bacterium]